MNDLFIQEVVRIRSKKDYAKLWKGTIFVNYKRENNIENKRKKII